MGCERKPKQPGVKKSVDMAILLSLALGHEPSVRQGKMLESFAKLSLAMVDDRGDSQNYCGKTRARSLMEVFNSYYGYSELHPRDFTLPSNEGALGFEQAEEIIKKMVKHNMGEGVGDADGAVFKACVDWFMANLVWEYIGQGGDISIFLGENNAWDKYLRSPWEGINKQTNTESGWDIKEEDERIEVYRAVTGYWYTKAVCACLGIEGDRQRFQLMNMAGTVYQWLSDMRHKKNHGEPTFLAHREKQRRVATEFSTGDWVRWIHTRLGPEVPAVIARPYILAGMGLGQLVVTISLIVGP